MKSALRFILVSVFFFVCGATVLWYAYSRITDEKMSEIMLGAPTLFRNINESSIDGVLWYAARLAMDDVGRTAAPKSLDFMRKLVRTHHMDEINVVSSNGVVQASNLPELVGLNLTGNANMRPAFEMLRDSTRTHLGKQPFRHGVGNSQTVSKYYNLQFPDGSGFLEVGITLEHFKRSIRSVEDYNYSTWTVGQFGYFEPVDEDGDGLTDESDSGGIMSVGEVGFGVSKDGERAYVLEFACFGLKFRAVVPMREFLDQQRKILLFTCVLAGIFFVAFTVFAINVFNAATRLRQVNERVKIQTDKDLSAARSIQLSALQRAELFRMAELDCSIAAVTYPARQVGGDLYAMFELPDGRIGFAVGDVSGKGIPAAMFMHVAKNTFELVARTQDDLAEVVAKCNEYLCDRNSADMFVTGWFGIMDPVTGIVEYVNAGHNYPFIVRADGTVERISTKGGRFLGMFPKVKYRCNRLRLSRGDRLLLYTDGVTEAMNAEGKTYGESRLIELLGKRPRDICRVVKTDVDAFVGGAEQSDDLTMLVFMYNGRPRNYSQTFPADAASLPAMSEFVRGLVRFRFKKQEARLLNALDEVLSNIINYSSSPTVAISVENVPGRCRLTVTDSGDAYNPLSHVDPDTRLKLQDRPIGGLGILMAKKLVSSVKYSRASGKNVLQLVQLDFSGIYRQGV